MASASNAHAVLFNADLLDPILRHCARSDVAAVRLCCRGLEALASPHLFRTLLLSPQKRHIRRLIRISNEPKFAIGVREVVWQTAAYALRRKQPERADIDELFPPVEDSHQLKILSHILYNLSADENEALRNWEQLADVLAMGFRRLHGLKTLTVVVWYEGTDRDRHREMTLAKNRAIPPPFGMMRVRQPALGNHNESFWIVLHAVQRSGCILRDINMLSPRRDPPKPGQPEEYDSGMIVSFHGFPDFEYTVSRFSAMLKYLTSLHLDLSPEDSHYFRWIALWEGSLAGFLAPLSGLSTIHIRLGSKRKKLIPNTANHTVVIPLSKIFGNTVFPQLQRLSLADLWLEPQELCDVLSTHEMTLEEVSLSNVNLGGTNLARPVHPGIVDLFGVHLPNMYLFLNSPEMPREWNQVAATCQNLPKLAGLKIEHPSYSIDFISLKLHDQDELIETAMDGRNNRLLEGTFEGVWEFLGAKEGTW